ncbi:hypothetical protein E4U59_001153 [Claviceps monticola]|nr:hypothetical protein E4U59_001153 [Claviceps monticola]
MPVHWNNGQLTLHSIGAFQPTWSREGNYKSVSRAQSSSLKMAFSGVRSRPRPGGAMTNLLRTIHA